MIDISTMDGALKDKCVESLLSVFKYEPKMLVYADNSIKDNKDFMLPIVTAEGTCLEYTSDRLKSDRDIVMNAVKSKGAVLRFASIDLQNEEDIVYQAILSNPTALHYANDRFKKDKTFILKILNSKNAHLLEYADISIREDRDIMRIAIGYYPDAVRYLSSRLRNDAELILPAVKANLFNIVHAGKTLLCNIDFALDIAYLVNINEFDKRNILTKQFTQQIFQHKGVDFLLKCKEVISAEDWPVIKHALLNKLPAFFEPPPVIRALAESSSSQYLMLAQYALSQELINIPVGISELPVFE